MSVLMTRTELLALIPGLSDARLDALVAAGVVRPAAAVAACAGRDRAETPRFAPLDAARLRLALDLDEAFDLHDEALALVLSLIDQLNGARADMRAMLGALAEEPPETRARLRGVIRQGCVRAPG